MLDIEADELNLDALLFEEPFRYRKRGVERKLMIGEVVRTELDHVLIANIARANAWLTEIRNGRTFDDIAETCNTSKRRILQVIDHAFLAPDIVEAAIKGQAPAGLTSEWLQRNELPPDWDGQRQMISRL